MQIDQQAENHEEVAETAKDLKSLDVVVYATEKCIKVLSQNGKESFGSEVYCEFKPNEDRKFTFVIVKADIVIAVQQNGLVQRLKLELS